MYPEPVVNNGINKLPTSTGKFTGFLNHQQLKGWIHGPCKLSLWETRSKAYLNPVSPCWTSHGQMMFKFWGDQKIMSSEKHMIRYPGEFEQQKTIRSFTFGFIVSWYILQSKHGRLC